MVNNLQFLKATQQSYINLLATWAVRCPGKFIFHCRALHGKFDFSFLCIRTDKQMTDRLSILI